MNDGLLNEASWLTVFNASYNAIEDETGKFNSIEKIILPGVFTNKFIRIYLNSVSAKPKWWLGGTLVQLLQNDSQLDFEVKRWRVPLRVISLIEINQVTTEYKLKLEPASWLKDIAIVIEQYIGE